MYFTAFTASRARTRTMEFSAISQSFSKKETVWRNQREAVRIHSFSFVRPVGGHNVRGTTRTQYRAVTQLFWVSVMMSDG